MKRLIITINDGMISGIFADCAKDEQIEVDVIDYDCFGKDAEYYDESYTEDMERVDYEVNHNKELVALW